MISGYAGDLFGEVGGVLAKLWRRRRRTHGEGRRPTNSPRRTTNDLNVDEIRFKSHRVFAIRPGGRTFRTVEARRRRSLCKCKRLVGFRTYAAHIHRSIWTSSLRRPKTTTTTTSRHSNGGRKTAPKCMNARTHTKCIRPQTVRRNWCVRLFVCVCAGRFFMRTVYFEYRLLLFDFSGNAKSMLSRGTFGMGG